MMVQSILDDKEAHLEKIKALFSQMAYNEEGGITFAMFEEKINSAAVKEYFATLGLDVWDAWSFFKLLDADAGWVVCAFEGRPLPLMLAKSCRTKNSSSRTKTVFSVSWTPSSEI